MISIREFEAFFDHKDFRLLKPTDVDAYRSDLRRRAHPLSKDAVSRSTIQHRASHIRKFLNWLIDHEGFGRLSRGIAGYIELSKDDVAKAEIPDPRFVPSNVQTVHLVASMPTKRLIERRDRAIVATTLLLGTRADATASLLLKHVDLKERRVYQIATESRIKNSKTQTTRFFLGDPLFEDTLSAWVRELEVLGAQPGDALFPSDRDLL